MDELAVGIDLATSNARAVACDLTGTVLASSTRPLPAPVRGDHRSRQDPSYWPVVRVLLADLAHRLGPRAGAVRALTVTGTSGSLVPCDGAGTPTGQTSLYDDPVATDQAARLTDAGAPAGPTSALARLGWLSEHEPAAAYLHTCDVVTTALAGHRVPTDTSHALKEGIDPVHRSHDEALLRLLHVDPAALPELVHPGTVLGELDDTVAAELGLPGGVLLVAGMTDGCTAQIAAGAVSAGTTVGVLGTTLVLKGVSETDVSGFSGAVYSHYAPDGSFWPGGASNVGAGAITARFPGADLARLDDAARRHGPARTVRYPLVDRGERFPFAAPEATGFAVPAPGVDRVAPSGADEVDDYRALLEGVAFTERLGLETLASLGVRTGEHRVVGGASASRVWNRIRATVLGLPVTRSAEPHSAFGAAVLAAGEVAGRTLADSTRAMVHVMDTVEPDDHEADALDDRYRTFLAELGRRGLVPDAGPGLRTSSTTGGRQ